MQARALVLIPFLSCASWAADDLPERTPGEPLDFEPSLRLTDVEPVEPLEPEEAGAEPPIDLEAAKAALEAAKRKHQRWQQLAKRGVLSKKEAESTSLQLARATVRYENSRVAHLRQELEGLRKRADAGQLPAEALQAAEAALASTTQLAADAEAALKRTERMLAETNLHRQRQLHAAGLGSRAQLQRAEAAVQKLTAIP